MISKSKEDEMRGGARVGAGRPKGSANRRVQLEPVSPEGETPLGYLLRIMRDGNIDPKRRDALARAALPYCHNRLHPVGDCPDDPNAPRKKTAFEELFGFGT